MKINSNYHRLFSKTVIFIGNGSFLNKHLMVRHELRVASCELRVTSYELKAQKDELNLKVRVQIHELRVQIYELGVQIQELRIQTHKFKNHLINENSSKQS